MVAPGAITVVVAMLGEGGHLRGTFALARRLRARGHRVIYLGLADLRSRVAAEGFEFLTLAEALLPAGFRDPEAPTLSRRAREARFVAFLGQILDGPLDRLLADAKPDVVLCDTFVWYVALRALRLGLPVVDLSIVLSSRPNGSVPPITTAIPPGTGRLSRLRVRASWWLPRGRACVTKSLASRLFGACREPTRMHHLVGVFAEVARRSAYPLREGRSWYRGEMGPRLALPEIALVPRELELPGSPETERLYAGDVVDSERQEEEALPDVACDDGAPLVYGSLGTSPSFYPAATRLFAAFVEASRARPAWRFVLHTADAAPPALPHPVNLAVRARVPQLALLRRATAMVTHGGVNSILEAVHFRVPLAIFPAARDQPGNALRAERLGIGRVARLTRVDASGLLALVDAVAGDPTIRAALAGLDRRIRSSGGVDRAVRLIEATAAARGRGSS